MFSRCGMPSPGCCRPRHMRRARRAAARGRARGGNVWNGCQELVHECGGSSERRGERDRQGRFRRDARGAGEARNTGCTTEQEERREDQTKRRPQRGAAARDALSRSMQRGGDRGDRDAELAGDLVVAEPSHLTEVDHRTLRRRQERDRGADLACLLGGGRDLIDRLRCRRHSLECRFVVHEVDDTAATRVDPEVARDRAEPRSPVHPEASGWTLVGTEQRGRGNLLRVFAGRPELLREALERCSMLVHETVECGVVERGMRGIGASVHTSHRMPETTDCARFCGGSATRSDAASQTVTRKGDLCDPSARKRGRDPSSW